MIQPNDPIIEKRSKQFKGMYDKEPHRDWKHNLSPERIAELKKYDKRYT